MLRKTRLYICLALACAMACPAQKPTPLLRPPFLALAWEAAQDIDLIEEDSTEIAYALAYLNARKSVNAAGRFAAGAREVQAANALWAWVEQIPNCRAIRISNYVTKDGYKNCLDRETPLRDKAVAAIGLDNMRMYPRTPAAKPQPSVP